MMTCMSNISSWDLSEDNFDVPKTLLLVRKTDVNSYFRQNKTPDGATSYVTSHSSTYNTYTFANIGQMANFMYKERDAAVLKHIKEVMKLKVEAIDEQLIRDMTRDWTLANPDWNKCCLIPVETTVNTSTNTITSVTHDLSLSAARLLRGTEESPIRIQVYYTRVASGN